MKNGNLKPTCIQCNRFFFCHPQNVRKLCFQTLPCYMLLCCLSIRCFLCFFPHAYISCMTRVIIIKQKPPIYAYINIIIYKRMGLTDKKRKKRQNNVFANVVFDVKSITSNRVSRRQVCPFVCEQHKKGKLFLTIVSLKYLTICVEKYSAKRRIVHINHTPIGGFVTRLIIPVIHFSKLQLQRALID